MTKHSVMSATEARVHFGELMRRVRNGEIVTIERRGKPTAVAMPYVLYHELKTRQEAWEAAEATAHKRRRGEAMTRTVSATEARIHLGEQLQRIENNDVIMIEHEGSLEAVVVSNAEYQRLRNNQKQRDDWWELARRSREALADRERSIDGFIQTRRMEQQTEPDDSQADQRDWRQAFAHVRASMRDENGDEPLDIDDIIHKMREERVAELLDGLR